MPDMKCPCKGCQDRTVTCHYDGYCDKWAEWKQYEKGKKEWLDSFKPTDSDEMRKREIKNIKARARGSMRKVKGLKSE